MLSGLCYVDFIIYSKTFEYHVDKQTRVLERIHNVSLKLRPDKCKLFQRRVSLLGYIVSEKSMEPDPEKVKAVVEWPTPQDAAELRSFTGLCSYYCSFNKDQSIVTAPLFDHYA